MLEPGKAAQFPVNQVICTEVSLLNGLGLLQYTHTHREQTYTQLCEHSGFKKATRFTNSEGRGTSEATCCTYMQSS